MGRDPARPPDYYTPLEAAQLAHFAMGTRLVAFGVLGWLFLPLLPLVPLKLVSARRANLRMNEIFRAIAFPTGVIPPGKKFSGFVFTRLDEGVKRIDVQLLGRSRVVDFSFMVEVPGLVLPHRRRKQNLPRTPKNSTRLPLRLLD